MARVCQGSAKEGGYCMGLSVPGLARFELGKSIYALAIQTA